MALMTQGPRTSRATPDPRRDPRRALPGLKRGSVAAALLAFGAFWALAANHVVGATARGGTGTTPPASVAGPSIAPAAGQRGFGDASQGGGFFGGQNPGLQAGGSQAGGSQAGGFQQPIFSSGGS